MSWFPGRLLSWDWTPLLLEEAGRTQCVPECSVCVSLTFRHVPNHAPHISPSGIHERCMAWLGHPHVPVPSNSEVVPQLPHRQVGDLGSSVAALLHMALLGGLLPRTAVTQAIPHLVVTFVGGPPRGEALETLGGRQWMA